MKKKLFIIRDFLYKKISVSVWTSQIGDGEHAVTHMFNDYYAREIF